MKSRLLKPARRARFTGAASRVQQRLADQTGVNALRSRRQLYQRPVRGPYFSHLTVRTGDKILILKTAEIDAIESAGNYVAVQYGRESHILRETLSGLARQLDPEKFLRISRSAIVNLERVKELQPMFKGEHVLVLHNGKRIAMTRSLREVERALRFS